MIGKVKPVDDSPEIDLELQDLDKYAGHPIMGGQCKHSGEVIHFSMEGGSGGILSDVLNTHAKPQPLLAINADEECEAFTLGDVTGARACVSEKIKTHPEEASGEQFS